MCARCCCACALHNITKMSVWKSMATTKLDIARHLYETLPNDYQKFLGDNISDYLSSIMELSTWDELAELCGWQIVDVTTMKFNKHYGEVNEWYLGSSGLYQLINAISTGEFHCQPAFERNMLDSFADEIGRIVAPSTQVAIDKFMKHWGFRVDQWRRLGCVYEDCSEAFKKIKFMFGNTTDDLIEIDQDEHFGIGHRIYYGHIIGNLCLMKGSGNYSNKGIVFTRAHLNLLIEGLMRLANTYFYLATEYANESDAAKQVHKMVLATLEDGFRAERKNADKVVQAYHEARMYAQMRIFENVHTGALNDARNEFDEKFLTGVIKLDEYLKIVDETPTNRRLDVLHVYKWMFPPDFDSTYAFDDLYKCHMNPRPSGADSNASSEMQANWVRVQEERKRNIVLAYHRKVHEWPTSVENDAVACQANNIHEWPLMKLFPYESYGKDIVVQIKDKSTVSASKKRELEGQTSLDEQSFLIWYMVNAGSVDTEEDTRKLVDGSLEEDNYAKVAYKGESHKPGSRLCFMAPPRARILLGELEGNISDVARYYPGSLQGKDSHWKSSMMQELFNIYAYPPDVDTSIPFEIFVITFGLSKLSPKSNYNVIKDYHDFWAIVFGKPAISKLAEIGPKSLIMHTQSGLKMTYNNKGADLQGYRGRMMTLFHADMLAAACRKARDLKITTGKAVVAVFIDDGAVKVAIRGSEKGALANANRFLVIMQEIYASAGQEIHPNKTIVSRVGGELLEEQYLYSHMLKVPIKAAMRLYLDYENPACSLTEELDALFAASQSCAMDQGGWSPTYYRYVMSFLKAISQWDKNEASRVEVTEMALKIITPKSFSGFGLQPWNAMFSTAALDMTVEGLGMLNRVARSYPPVAPRVYKIISQPILIRNPLLKLRDPTRIRASGPVLVENRLMVEIIKLLEEPDSPAANFMEAYRSGELHAHALAVAEAVLGRDVVSIPLLNRVWECTPLAYVESVVSKFRRATMISLLGPERVGQVRSANSKDVIAVLKHRIN